MGLELELIKLGIYAACTSVYEIHHHQHTFLEELLHLSPSSPRGGKNQDQRGTGFGSR